MDFRSQPFFRQKNKKIILLVDNCPAHKVDSVSDRLDFVKVVFLPANVTSLIQPCDAGVIKAFKAAYRRNMLHKVTQLVDDPSVPIVDTPVLKKHIKMLHCLQFSRAAWDSLSPDTIKNCWRKAGFSVAAPNEGTSDAGTVEVAAAPSSNEGELTNELFELEELDATAPSSVHGAVR